MNMIRYILILFVCISFSANAQVKSTVVSYDEFLQILENAIESGGENNESNKEFKQGAWAFWKAHMLDYNQHPEKYKKALSLYYQYQQKYKRNNAIKIDRFESQIENFRRFDNRNTLVKNPILFVGSSSIVFWETAKSFPDLPIINRGFGGASVAELIHFYDDILKKHSPSVLIVYSDIVIERGKSPEVAVDAYKKLLAKVKNDFPQTQILLLSMKPTLIDDFLGKDVAKNKSVANKMLEEFSEANNNLHFINVAKTMRTSDGSLRSDIFLPDGMHMNSLGYTLWNPVIRSKISDLKR